MNEDLNLIICGLSGQGIILTERLLVIALSQEGRNVLSADVPPWTHRNALTYCYIRTGEELYSPRIPEGGANLIVAFEPLVALQVSAIYGNKETTVITNNYPIETRGLSRDGLRDMSEQLAHKYPTVEEILDYLKQLEIKKVRTINGTDISFRETGSARALNMVMLGAAYATNMIPIRRESLEVGIMENTPPGTGEINLKAFKAGMSL
ncbi:MAG: 2-oxoacid:acceptor oxidoreductase family protein [Candidatus Jordarchaeum sp.]|uniref:2-oxoacid:acceptor oxidoreductase family protein n=1 Tax=Candidatus Jordarchaeum sp. TaxID=2823881 RepID=UPI00404A5034